MDKYIFEINDINYEFDYNLLANIEKNLSTGITYEEAIYFLHWLIYKIKLNLPNPSSNLIGYCGFTRDLIMGLSEKLQLEAHPFNLRKIVNDDNVSSHAATIIKFKIKYDGKLIEKKFLFDPTFRQFCVTEYCSTDKYFNNSKGRRIRSTPYEGYYFGLTAEGKLLGTKLINDGFIELTAENIKLYCDAFRLRAKELLADYSLGGQQELMNLSGSDYLRAIYSLEPRFKKCSTSVDFRLPSEILISMSLSQSMTDGNKRIR